MGFSVVCRDKVCSAHLTDFELYGFLLGCLTVVGGLSFTSILLSSFVVSCPPSSLNGTQPKLATCSEVNAVWKCMSEIWGIPSP